ncbi:uncharacterized protein DFL_001402 [Arthrobotrys flagrans]|uniref:Vacuolar protein sorting-associated protein 62 n=1 Tax=Arthrobotrys flagrans TaxID=97331 RepID=A0A437AH18_ARTFL|nr:hypothetical protein DFL_001402 [Arthrobotrys flagrans]
MGARTLLFSLLVFLHSFFIPLEAAVLKRGAPPGVPQYALDYAPLVYLHSDDEYRPSNIRSMLRNTQPLVNFQPIPGAPKPVTLDNLDQLNNFGGDSVYLTSVKDVAVDSQQAWLKGVTPDATGLTNGAISAAILVNEKDATTTDVFYFYFYNFNSGPPVWGIKFGDHVGDWEHMMVRFQNGVPSALWYSQHADGQAFTYEAVEKLGQRPIGYSAKGSHANYAMGGRHDHTIPNFNLPGAFFLVDDTNKGVLWDPTLSAYYYKFDAGTNSFTSYNPASPVNWLYFKGKWGDQQYPKEHEGQYILFGQARYSSGPTGPLGKELQRKDVCPSNVKPCWVRPFLTAKLEKE